MTTGDILLGAMGLLLSVLVISVLIYVGAGVVGSLIQTWKRK